MCNIPSQGIVCSVSCPCETREAYVRETFVGRKKFQYICMPSRHSSPTLRPPIIYYYFEILFSALDYLVYVRTYIRQTFLRFTNFRCKKETTNDTGTLIFFKMLNFFPSGRPYYEQLSKIFNLTVKI